MAPQQGRYCESVAIALANRRVLVLLASLVLFAPCSVMAGETKQILLLHSFGRGIAPWDAIVAAFRTELARASDSPIAIYEVSLEAGQTSTSDDQEPFLQLLRFRFAGKPPAVTVAIGRPAAGFYLRNREKLFPSTPVVLSGLEKEALPEFPLHDGDYAVVSHNIFMKVIENIVQVLPDTNRIELVYGASPLERTWTKEERPGLEKFADRVTFEWLNDLSFEQVLRRVSNLPPHTAIFYFPLIVDAAGVPHDQLTGLARLHEVANAPIFGYFESELGHGVVGGPNMSERSEGLLLANATLRAVRGPKSATATFDVLTPERPVYDWRALKRWNIDFANLPAGSAVRFRPPSLWDEHRALIMTAATVFAIQAALLVSLLWERSRRRRAESAARDFSGRLIDAHEDERRWLARELHDDITQRLAGMAIAAAKLSGPDGSQKDFDTSRSIRSGLVQLSEDVHSLSYRLHPSVLDDLGLIEALKTECERVERVEHMQVKMDAEIPSQGLPKDAALGIYRVAQEALRNIGRHAKASAVQLSVAPDDGGLRLTVSDNGSGFEPALQAREQRPSLGHASMRERMRLLGGRLEIHSSPGAGTTILAWVPVPRSIA
jgi:signal transduction histidine kinase